MSSPASEAAHPRTDEPIAVVGIGAVFPDAPTLEAFGENLRAGRCAIRPVSAERRWFTSAPDDGDYRMAALDRVDRFDRGFFGISAAEAEAMDPHQRMALELAWSAVEAGAVPLGRLRAEGTGVFLSAAASRYGDLLERHSSLAFVGTAPSGVAGRVSYHLGLSGPSLAVDTGCSASLVAVGLATDALQARRCRFALAGGVSVRVDFPGPDAAGFAEVMARDGFCRAFDAAADGTADGEGGAVLLLERLRDATADGHPVLAVIRAVSANHNGDRAIGLTAPSVDAQVQLMTETWRRAGLDLAAVRFIEAHGSGTRLGDAIELTALDRALSSYGTVPRPIPVGSVKSNIGHLDHAAGVAGLCKAIIGLNRGTVFPTLHFERLNPAADVSGGTVRIARTAEDYAVAEGQAALVSSFGITGMNAHAVVTAPPARPAADDGQATGPHVVTLSAASAETLVRYRHSIAQALEDTAGPVRLADVAATLNHGRADLPVRWSAVVGGVAELAERLRSEDAGAGRTIPSGRARAVVAVFPHPPQVPGGGPPPGAPPGAPADQASRYRALAAIGVRPEHHLATGHGHHALAELGRAVPGADPEAPLNRAALRSLVARLADKDPVYLLMSTGSALGSALTDLGADTVTVPQTPDPHRDCLEAAARLYRLGAHIAWPPGPGRPGGVSLPTYPFAAERCWPVPPGPPARQRAAAAPAAARPFEPAEVLPGIEATVCALLGIEDPGADPDYFALGGNSLLALELLTTIERRYGAVLTLPDLYRNSALADLAALVVEGARSRELPGDAIPAHGGTEWQLSFGQESLLFLNELDADAAVYNVTADLRLTGPLDVEALRRALERLARRHLTLTGRYERREDEIVAVVDPRAHVELPVHDVPPGSPQEREAWAAHEAQRIALRPYDLTRGPLHRFALIRFDDQDSVLIFGSHHSVDDGWSPAIVDHELSAFYASELSGLPADLPELPISYGDFARWQRTNLAGERLDAKVAFWREYLDGCQAADLAADRPRPRKLSDRGEHVELRLTAAQVAGLRALARERRCTMFVVVLAAFEAALFRYSRTGDFAVGVVVSGRERPETRGLIGYFNNMVPVRATDERDDSFGGLIDRVRESFLATVPHHDLPFAKLVEALRLPRDLGSHPVFQIGFTYQNIPRLDERLGGLAVRPTEGAPYLTGLAPARAPWDLNLTVWDVEGADDFKAVFEFASDLFDRASGEDFADEFRALLDALLAEPGLPLSRLRPEPGPRAEAAAGVSDACFPVRSDATEGLLESLARIAAADPDRPAVMSPKGAVGYGELARRIGCFAAGLRARGVRAGDVVALILGRHPDIVVAMLGTWAAGAAYLPLDPGYPAARVRTMLDLARPALLIVHADDPPLPAGAWPTATLGQIEAAAAGPEPLADDANLPKWLIFTSGSTGTPKGVLVGGAALAPFVSAWRGIGQSMGTPLRVLSTASPAFDVFTGDLIRALATGGALVVVPPDQAATAADLAEAIRRYEVTAVELVPAQLRKELADWLTDRGETLDSLRLVVNGLAPWTGRDKAAVLARCAPGAAALTIFGITEAVIDNLADLSRGPRLGHDPWPGPVGLPLDAERAYVLDREQRPVARGAIGELYLGGDGLALGYLGNAALTAERFLPDPHSGVPGARMYRTGDRMRRRPDGRLEFLGRLDGQLKVNGSRIEPGDVEAALLTHPAVACAAVGSHGEDAAARLVAWVAAGGAVPPTPADLRRHLRGLLPDYLVPSHIAVLPELALTPHGKVDTAALPPPLVEASARGSRPAPRSDTEFELAALFGQVLGRDAVGIHDDFFQAGGHSLLAMRLTAGIEARWGLHLPLSALFEHTTVAELATLLRSGHPVRRAPVLRLATGSGTPLVLCEPSGGTSFCYQPLARSLAPHRPVFGLQSAGVEGEQAPLTTMDSIVGHHAAALAEAGIHGPVIVGGWSYGGVLAHALATRLRADGVAVPLTVLFDAAPADLVPRRLPDADEELLRYLLVLNHAFTVAPGGADDRTAALLAAAQDAGLLPPGLTRDGLAALLAVLRANEEAAAAHRPGYLDGELLLLRTADGPEPDRNHAPDLGWGPYAGEVSVRVVDGGHYTLVPSDYAGLGRELSAELISRGL